MLQTALTAKTDYKKRQISSETRALAYWQCLLFPFGEGFGNLCWEYILHMQRTGSEDKMTKLCYGGLILLGLAREFLSILFLFLLFW